MVNNLCGILMRLIKIPNCSYEQFVKIRNVIDKNIPFAVIDIRYNPDLKLGIFNFWDSDYIVDELKQYIVQPPLSRENKEKMSLELAEVVK